MESFYKEAVKMRVLWFTNTPSNFLKGTNVYNGGGWISSLELEIKKRNDLFILMYKIS